MTGVPITLTSATLVVTVTPERGADIVQITDLKTGVATLAVSPTKDSKSSFRAAGGSMEAWTQGYPGGWQIMTPNAGPEREHDGAVQGYHGEASLASWQITDQSDSAATLTTTLFTAPLRLERTITVDHEGVQVTDVVINLSAQPCSFRLGQHPAFGTPFIDAHSYLTLTAATLLTDPSAPGSFAGPDVAGPPGDLLPAGPVPDSIALPAPGSGQSFFGALSNWPVDGISGNGGPATSATFCSPTHGFGMRITWNPELYPHAWLWLEANAGAGWPWFKRLYSAAVEPVNVLPGMGLSVDGRPRGGPGTRLGAHERLVSQVRVDRVSL